MAKKQRHVHSARCRAAGMLLQVGKGPGCAHDSMRQHRHKAIRLALSHIQLPASFWGRSCINGDSCATA
jgi:hypothetical protein